MVNPSSFYIKNPNAKELSTPTPNNATEAKDITQEVKNRLNSNKSGYAYAQEQRNQGQTRIQQQQTAAAQKKQAGYAYAQQQQSEGKAKAQQAVVKNERANSPKEKNAFNGFNTNSSNLTTIGGTVNSLASKSSKIKSSISKKSGINTKAANNAYVKVKKSLDALERDLIKFQKDVETMNANYWHGSKPANNWYTSINKTYMSLINFNKGVNQLQSSLKSLFTKASSKGINF